MAYVAVVSLKHTLHRLLDSSIGTFSRELLESASVEVKSVQQNLKRLDGSSRRSKRLNKLDGEIREALHKLEESLESHESIMLLPDIHGDLELQEVRQETTSLFEKVKKMEEEFIKESETRFPEKEEEDDCYNDTVFVSSNRDFGVEMIGFAKEVGGIKKKLLGATRPDDFGVFSIVGRAGSGRTIAGRIVFEELCIGQEKCLDCGAWVNVGPKYEWKQILVTILRQTAHPANPEPTPELEGDEELLLNHLHARLKGQSYMIALDDVCDTKVWDYLQRSFPKQDNGSLVLLTTSLLEVAKSADSFHISRMPDFDEHAAWELLCSAMFNGPPCQPKLNEVGKKIVKNCQGLRLVLPKVLLFLSRTKNTPEKWNDIAEDEENPIFMVAHELLQIIRIKEELYSSVPDDDQRSKTIKAVSRMLDLSGQAVGIKLQMFPKRLHPKMELFSICGMAGLGKTTLVKKVFEDPLILHHFDHHAWITLGPNYQSEEFLVDILAKLYVQVDKMHLREDEKLVKDLCSQLSNKRCLIVLDDLWNKQLLHHLQELLPDIKGEIFVTTRLFEVAKCGRSDFVYNMPLLDEEQSWLLFCRKVFASEFCPIRLEKSGKRICKNCEGLPLLILTVADLLSRADMSPEYWEEIAENKSSLFMEAQAQMSNVLSPSYNYLPQHLKVCFLYMGVFSQNYEIPTSKLIQMWAAEGFLEPNPSQTLKDSAMDCLSGLVGKSVVMVCKKVFKAKIKTCRLHPVFWHLSNSEAAKNKFFLTLSIYAHNSVECVKGYRRLCIRSGVLFSIKDLRDSMKSIPTVHSLLYSVPYHQYPVSISLSSRLLRVLDALMIRFYEFPIELVALCQLTYLALSCDGQMPSAMSKLQNLQYLIISRHLSIKSQENSSYLPAEIWDMKELNHLQVVGGCLPNPSCGTPSHKLSILLDIDAHSCTKSVLKRIPKLKKLGILIELPPDDDSGKSFRCLNRISRLRRLESLRCVVVNPELMTAAACPPAPRSMFPPCLKKLSLSGIGYPWEYMSIIGNLQNLETLKLQCYAFQGPRWETNYRGFRKLKYLLMEDTDLVWWKITAPSFVNLEHISIKHCYNFEELPLNILSSVKMVEVDECNSVVMNWAEQMKGKKAWDLCGMPANKKQVSCSWDSGKNFKE